MNKFFKSWKTTSAGIIAIVSGVVNYLNDKTQIVESLTSILLGFGLIFSKDYDQSGPTTLNRNSNEILDPQNPKVPSKPI
jgi:hypothetical protein